MTPTPRRRSAVAYLLTAVLLSTFAVPVLAAPSTEVPTSPIASVLDWLADLFRGPSGLDRATGEDQAAPLIDPNGVTAVGPVGQVDGADGITYTPPNDDGEAAPYIDPNG